MFIALSNMKTKLLVDNLQMLRQDKLRQYTLQRSKETLVNFDLLLWRGFAASLDFLSSSVLGRARTMIYIF